ncbi:MAG TPA: acylphosphatase [Gammaproteobacteria bacterium]|nr:acylphosphatase [Gammaproteobacteria bacterium]
MKIARRCVVSGKVQGVFYRASTAERARALGLTGYARNLADGCVEVLACGEETKVRELVDWLWQGPPAAEVQGVQVQDADAAQAPVDFSTR